MMYNNFSIVDYQKSEDENKAIQKLAEHRDIKLMVKEIGEKYGIDIQSTEENSHLGDFSYLLWSSFFVTPRPNFCHRGHATP